MSAVYPVEPADGWHEGDLAYCVNSRTRGTSIPRLERGRVYRVSSVVKPASMAHYGLTLDGVETPGAAGFWSNKFVRIGPVGGRLGRIAAATQHTMAHYWKRPS